MNINKMTQDAEQLWTEYKKSDPIMLKKTFAMKDVFYRKNSPGHELWHTEVSFDYDFYFVALAAGVAATAILMAFCRMCRSVRPRRCKKRK